jgi:hypothetical protein
MRTQPKSEFFKCTLQFLGPRKKIHRPARRRLTQLFAHFVSESLDEQNAQIKKMDWLGSRFDDYREL